MRFYKNVGCYYGRQPERRQQTLNEMLPSKRPDKSASGRSGIGDVKDAHLTGKGGPFSDAHDVKKK